MLCPGPTIWHFPPPSSFLSPPSIFAYLLLVPSLCPSTSLLHHSPLTSLSALSLCHSVSLFLFHVNTVWLGDLLSSLGLIEHTRTGIETKQVSMTYLIQSYAFYITQSVQVEKCLQKTSSCPLCIMMSCLSRLSLPDQILPHQQSQWTSPRPQDKGQRLPRLDGLWTSQCRGVRVLLLKAWLTFAETWITTPQHRQ